ncbi:RNA polymerase sigma factor [Gemmata obscuriglobus]|nr:sigma-70 family RNA polymerase sigma factor [Gemmata obscuriglobus]
MESLLTWIRHRSPDPRSDDALLGAFLSDHDERAFAEVVRRHGPVVWGACHRLLPDPADAEDAFQAAFLVLVRRGRQAPALLGPWLHRVAVLTARGVRRRNARRLARVRPLPTDLPRPPSPAPVDLDGLLLGLPEKYRVAVVLCYLEGRTEQEAAERIGCPVGTLSARLSRALARLRARTGADPRVLLVAAATGAVPAVAEAVAVRTAVSRIAAGATGAIPNKVSSLAEGVVRMLRLKTAAWVVVAGLVVVACVGLIVRAASPPQAPPVARSPDSKAAAGGGGPDPKVAARAAIREYQRHWDRLDRVRLQYTQYGAAEAPKTFEDAAGLRWKKMDKAVTGDFILDGPRWLLKVDYDDPPFDPNGLVPDKDNPDLAWGRAPLTYRYLGNGAENLYYCPRDKHASLFEGGAGDRLGSSTPRSTPLHVLGFRNPECNPHDLLAATDRNGSAWSAGLPADVNGAACVPVSFVTPNGFRTVFHLDPRRGHLPLRVQVFGDVSGKEEEFVRTDVLEVRAHPGDRWLPTKVRTIRFPPAQGKFLVNVKEVTKCDLEPPKEDELSVELAAGTGITRQDKPQAKYGFHFPQGGRVGPDDLPRLIADSERKGKP